jgi:hypothetical protein
MLKSLERNLLKKKPKKSKVRRVQKVREVLGTTTREKRTFLDPMEGL